MKRKKLGEVLRERGHISSEDLLKAVEEQQGKLIHLGELMLERGLVRKAELGAAVAEVTRVPYEDCEAAAVDPEALKLLPVNVARRCCALPISCEGSRLAIAMAEPQNLQLLDELRFISGMEIAPRLAFRREILAAIEKAYGAEEDESEKEKTVREEKDEFPGMEFVSTSSLQRNIEAMQEMQAELLHKSTPAVRLVASTIVAAANKQASDIHIEPRASETVVRLRVDGMLREFERIPRSVQNSIVSRIKILSDMDIAERRTPQDGRFMVKLGNKKIDLRVSTLPTQYGEKVVMRLLEPEAPLQDFVQLGFAPEMAAALTRMLAQPQGMFLVTGPTGSGKSTTLYSALHLLRKPTVNIITVEDPVEYALPGVNQVQVNTKAGLTFAGCLRSILRQDPNVIMVGEIRDRETAEIALKAAQTGHLVLSTLHTNDSVSAITRLLDLGIPGFQIATSVSGIVAQRLLRRLCPCNREESISPEYLTRLVQAGMQEAPRTQRVPVGCDACDQTGYRGRVGIFEILVFDEAVRSAIRSGSQNDEIRNLAQANGMKLMQEQALEKVHRGLTILDEVVRIVPFETLPRAGCHVCHRELAPAFAFCPYCGTSKRGEEKIQGATPLVREGALQG